VPSIAVVLMTSGQINKMTTVGWGQPLKRVKSLDQIVTLVDACSAYPDLPWSSPVRTKHFPPDRNLLARRLATACPV